MRKPRAIARGKKTYRDRIEGRIIVENFAKRAKGDLGYGRALLRRTPNAFSLAVFRRACPKSSAFDNGGDKEVERSM